MVTKAPVHPVGRRRGRLRLLVSAARSVVLVAATAVLLPGVASAAVTSNQTGTNNGYPECGPVLRPSGRG